MCLKSVLRKVSKLCPMTSELDKLFAAGNMEDQDEVDAPHQEPSRDAGTEPKQTTASKIVKAKKKAPEAPADEVVDIEVVEDDAPEIDEDELPV